MADPPSTSYEDKVNGGNNMTKTKIGTANVVDGEATLEWTIPSTMKIGTSTIYGTYIENDTYMTDTAYNTIQVRRATTTVVQNVLASVGEQATFTATVKHSTNQNVDEGTVQFQLGSSNIGSPVNVSNGVATLQYTIPSNVESGAEIRAYFLETNTYAASTSNAGTLTLRTGTDVTVTNISGNRGEQITINAQITDVNADPVNTGSAKLLIDDTIVSTQNVNTSTGAVSFNYTVAQNAILGSHVIKVQYQQNDSYDAGEGTGTLTVRTPTTLTAVNISANAGSTIPLTINVKDPNNTPIPSGTVNITVGSESPVPASVNASGEATIQYQVPQNASGTISFNATYVQNNNYQGSTMATAGVITIRKATSVVVDSKKANIGDTINLSATVTSGQEMVDEGTLDFEIE